mmetsp:Transcript_27172/g.70023  ORF Transcript_27172/g.70023 Transcript_27172/m.70023 type:complete len:327 (-) Transcript_27172:585-1565(-)
MEKAQYTSAGEHYQSSSSSTAAPASDAACVDGIGELDFTGRALLVAFVIYVFFQIAWFQLRRIKYGTFCFFAVPVILASIMLYVGMWRDILDSELVQRYFHKCFTWTEYLEWVQKLPVVQVMATIFLVMKVVFPIFSRINSFFGSIQKTGAKLDKFQKAELDNLVNFSVNYFQKKRGHDGKVRRYLCFRTIMEKPLEYIIESEAAREAFQRFARNCKKQDDYDETDPFIKPTSLRDEEWRQKLSSIPILSRFFPRFDANAMMATALNQTLNIISEQNGQKLLGSTASSDFEIHSYVFGLTYERLIFLLCFADSMHADERRGPQNTI